MPKYIGTCFRFDMQMPRYIGTCFRFYTQMRVEKKTKLLHIEFIVTSHNSEGLRLFRSLEYTILLSWYSKVPNKRSVRLFLIVLIKSSFHSFMSYSYFRSYHSCYLFHSCPSFYSSCYSSNSCHSFR